MSDSWGQVFPGFDHPVRGQVSSYTAASQACLTLKSVTETCGTEFHRLCSSESLDQLGGAAAEQLVTLVAQIDGSFAQVPPVFQSLADVFTKHAQRLEELRAQSAWALAVAHTRWATVTQSRTESSHADAAVAAIDRQIRTLEREAASDPLSADLLTQRYDDRRWLRDVAEQRLNDVVQAEAELEWSRADHETLVEGEQLLVDDTVASVRDIDLGDLEDPGRLMALLSDVAGVAGGAWDLVTDLVDAAGALAEAIASGDFTEALWRLSEYLDAAITLLTVVTIAAFIVGSVFCPALLAATPAMLALLEGLAAVKASTDWLICATQTPHPDTGQPMSAVTALTSVASAVLGSATSRTAQGALRSLPLVGSRSIAGQIAATQATGNAHRAVVAAGMTPFGLAVNPSTGQSVGFSSLRALVPSSRQAVVAADQRVGRLTGRLAENHSAAEFVDEFGDVFGDPVDNLVIDGLVSQLPPAWSNALAGDGSAAATTRHASQISHAIAAVEAFRHMGPVTSPTAPTFQLAGVAP